MHYYCIRYDIHKRESPSPKNANKVHNNCLNCIPIPSPFNLVFCLPNSEHPSDSEKPASGGKPTAKVANLRQERAMCGLLKAEYMGSGATLVDGVRRWFQRRTSSSSKPINTTDANTNPNPNPNPNPNNNYYSDQSGGNCNKSKYDNNDGHVFFASDLSAQSSTSLQKRRTTTFSSRLRTTLTFLV